MSKEITANFSSGNGSGTEEAKSTPSCVGVATEGLTRLYTYFRVSGTATFRQNDDGTIDFKVNSVTISQDNVQNDGYPNSPFYFHGLYANRNPFTIYDDPSGHSNFIGLKVTSAGNMTHSGNPGTCSGTFSGLNYVRIANNISELIGDGENVKVFIGGLVDYQATPTGNVTINAMDLNFEADNGFDEFLDYYPWERKINGTWKSLNRSESGAGLYRKVSGSWVGLKNGGETNHGFRYNNGWQVSPKSGQGA